MCPLSSSHPLPKLPAVYFPSPTHPAASENRKIQHRLEKKKLRIYPMGVWTTENVFWSGNLRPCSSIGQTSMTYFQCMAKLGHKMPNTVQERRKKEAAFGGGHRNEMRCDVIVWQNPTVDNFSGSYKVPNPLADNPLAPRATWRWYAPI